MNSVSDVSVSPIQIGAIYATLGWLWIITTDQLVEWLFPTLANVTYAQTGKGLVFVTGSAVLIYALTARSHRRLEAANDQLNLALRHSSVLHRVLRHNLRNTCNVIGGQAEMLREAGSDIEGEHLAIIEEEATDLVSLGEKTRTLESVVSPGPVEQVELDVTEVVESHAKQYETRYPHSTIDVTVPAEARIEAHPKFEAAIEELLENAIVHHESNAPTVRLVVTCREGEVVLEVADDGPGIPAIEQEALEAPLEEKLVHSGGLGLWVVQTLTVASGGRFDISSRAPTGTQIRLVF